MCPGGGECVRLSLYPMLARLWPKGFPFRARTQQTGAFFLGGAKRTGLASAFYHADGGLVSHSHVPFSQKPS